MTVHDTVLRHGSADFTDARVPATHPLRALELGVPFISSLPSQRQMRVQPLLAFTLRQPLRIGGCGHAVRRTLRLHAEPVAEAARHLARVRLRAARLARGPALGPAEPRAEHRLRAAAQVLAAGERHGRCRWSCAGRRGSGAAARGWPHPWGGRRVAARRDGQARPPRSRSAAGPRGLTRPRLPCAACARSAARPSARPAQRRRRWPHSAATRPGPRRMPTR